MQDASAYQRLLDLRDHWHRTESDSLARAEKWEESIRERMESLGNHPRRFPVAADLADLDIRRVPSTRTEPTIEYQARK